MSFLIVEYSTFFEYNVCVFSSPNLLGHPELQGIAILQYIDMLMFTEWVSKATDGVLQQVKVRATISSLRTLSKVLEVVGVLQSNELIEISWLDSSQMH